MNVPPLTGRPLAAAWVWALFSTGCAVAAALLIPGATTLQGFAGVVAVAGVALIVAALSAMYAATRSPTPPVLRLCRYGCAAGVLIAHLAL